MYVELHGEAALHVNVAAVKIQQGGTRFSAGAVRASMAAVFGMPSCQKACIFIHSGEPYVRVVGAA